MSRILTLRLLAFAGLALILLHVGSDLLASEPAWIEPLLADWFLPLTFLGCGIATGVRACAPGVDRGPWMLLGAGLVLYAAGNVYFNVALSDDPSPPFHP